MVNLKRILIESDTTETFRLRVMAPGGMSLYCPDCDAIEDMLDLNKAADVTGAPAREILTRVESGELHSPETPSGHFMICGKSLEHAINSDGGLQLSAVPPKENI